MQLIARLIQSGFGTRVFYVMIDGFDTHSQQAESHKNLVGEVADAITYMFQTLQQGGHDKRVVAMTFIIVFPPMAMVYYCTGWRGRSMFPWTMTSPRSLSPSSTATWTCSAGRACVPTQRVGCATSRRECNGGIERDHSGRQCALSQASDSLPLSSALSPSPKDRGDGRPCCCR